MRVSMNSIHLTRPAALPVGELLAWGVVGFLSCPADLYRHRERDLGECAFDPPTCRCPHIVLVVSGRNHQTLPVMSISRLDIGESGCSVTVQSDLVTVYELFDHPSTVRQ